MKNKIKVFFSELKSGSGGWFIFCAVEFLFLFLYFASLKMKLMKFPCVFSIADYLNCLCESQIINLVTVPLSMFMACAVSQQSLTSNYCSRHKKRGTILVKQYVKLIIASVGISLFIVASSILFGSIFAPTVYNWDNSNSYFFYARGFIPSSTFSEVIIVSYLKQFFSLLFYASVLLLLIQLSNKNVGIACITILSAIDILNTIRYVLIFSEFLGLRAPRYFDIYAAVLYLALIPVLSFVFFLVSLKAAKRKDYL